MQFVCKYSDVFGRNTFFMRLKPLIITFALLFSCIISLAGPARRTPAYMRQPDGSVFQAIIKGDEFTKIKTTSEGHAIVQDADGWWCYALFESDGTRVSSGWKVGRNVPAEILLQSSHIPYGILANEGTLKRRSATQMTDGPILKRLKSIETKSGDVVVTKHALVILANFSDVKFKHTREEFESLLTEEGYSVNRATGSAKEYFDAQFKGHMEFDFHVSDIVTLPKAREYYGGNDSKGEDKAPAEMIRDACRLVDADINFAMFDDDKDGKVDNVFLFFAGQDEAEGASDECIWSHSWYIRSGAGISLELDETIIDRYACTSELTTAYDKAGNVHEFISGIGTFCHEYSHTLGLPDFYDTDYEESGGLAAGLWTKTSLMDGGNYNNLGNTPPNYNAIERLIAGISEPVSLTETGTYTLSPIEEDGRSYMLSNDSGDFFLFECRSAKGWDSYIGGSGMLAYHIDMSEESHKKWTIYNEVNVDPEHQYADLLEADGRQDKFSTSEEYSQNRADIGGIFFPHGNVNFLNSESNPGLVYHDGEESKYTLNSIRKDGENIKFNFLGKDDIPLPPVAANITKDVFADAAIINFESSFEYEGDATVIWGRSGQDKDTLTVSPYEAGKYGLIFEGLEPSGKTYELDIIFISHGIEGEKRSTSVMTKRAPSAEWPYIYLAGMERNSDGTFNEGTRCPLRVYGAGDAAEIQWHFNGSPVKRGGDGYFHLTKSGKLQATIYWEDGRVEKVMKQIVISSQ